MKYKYSLKTMLLFIQLAVTQLYGQTFTLITDSSNPVTKVSSPATYVGAAWVDIDNDGDLDLHTSGGYLFRNDGNETFVQLETQLEANLSGQLGMGISWADYDNDGDIDCAIAGNPSVLYTNTGDGTFEEFIAKDFSPRKENRGWSCAWGDYNSDGYVDLIVAHPAGFIGASTPSFLFDGGPGGALHLNNSFEFSEVLAPYTVSIWSDFDLDNDIDLFIGSGPAGTAARDFNYINALTETGSAVLNRMDNLPMGSDLQDGQVWNWIDYDNDGDLDGYITNYGGAPNRFYVNNNGAYESINNELVLNGSYLGNIWGDVDNDGDIDVFLTGDTGNRFYLNNSDGTFTRVQNVINESGSSGASLGDYDNDGDLDIFIAGAVTGLYRNDTNNGNNWLNVSLVGNVSNKSAMGAKIRIRANINGNDVWQIREVSSQNSFNSHNSLRQHFGLGDATIIDSLIIFWPAGQVNYLTDVSTNQFLLIEEEIPDGFLRANFTVDSSFAFSSDQLTVNFRDASIADPNNPVISWQWDFDNDGIIDSEEQNSTYTYNKKGRYSISLTASNGTNEHTIISNELITVTGLLPEISLSKSNKTLGTLDSNEGVVADTFYVVNSGLGADSVFMSIDRINITSTNGITLSVEVFEINPGDSQQVVVSFDPALIEPKDRIVRAGIVATSLFSLGDDEFKVNYQFRVKTVTSVGSLKGVPEKFALEQNYPNPFNPTTTIRFSLTESNYTTLKVYNILGNELLTVVNENLNDGIYEVDFDASRLASGTYIYQLRSGKNIQTRKLVLVK